MFGRFLASLKLMSTTRPREIGIDFSGFDQGWFQSAHEEFTSNASNVITVATGDADREKQTIFLLQSMFREFLFQFDPWNGLQRWTLVNGNASFAPVSAALTPLTADYDQSVRNDARELEGALRSMDKILREQTSALIIRGVDPANDQSRSQGLNNAIREWALCGELTRRKSMVCLISPNPGAVLDKRTLDRTVLAQPSLSTDNERSAMIASVAKALKLTRSNTPEIAHLTAASRGLSLHQMRVALQISFHKTGRLDVEEIKQWKSNEICRSEVLEIENSAVGFGEVGGYEPVKKMVRNTLIHALRNSERAALAAMAPPRGLLIFGPPGTGKTLFAKAMAKETNLPFINLRTENLFGPWLGESGQRFGDAIRLAEQSSPAIVFVDEIDRFGKRQGSRQDGASQETARVFGQLLEWLGDENRRSIIVGTTNEPDDIDPALIRPGRFSYCVPFLYPNRTARSEILCIHLGLRGGRPKPAMDEDSLRDAIDEIARETRFYSGAELEEIVNRAKTILFSGTEPRMTGDHMRAAAADMTINTADRENSTRKHLETAARFGNSKSLIEALASQD